MIELMLNRKEVRDYSIRNLDALPRGTGARYLGCIRGEGRNVLIAKCWVRKLSSLPGSGCRVVIDHLASID